MKPKGSNEAFWWSLFSAGGVVAALIIPALILVTGVAPGLGWGAVKHALGQNAFRDLVSNALVKPVLLAAVGLPLFHALHRIRHMLIDLRVPAPRLPVAVAGYSAAFVGTGLAAYLLWRV